MGVLGEALLKEHEEVEKVFTDEGAWNGLEFDTEPDWDEVLENIKAQKARKGKEQVQKRKSRGVRTYQEE
eukprot:891110-Rhodomonas_salina.2